MVRVAMIGTGAAGFGVMQALQRRPDLKLVLFDHGAPLSQAGRPAGPPSTWRHSEFRRIYTDLRRSGATGIPLPKSHFGVAPSRIKASGKERIWYSRFEGGLTNFWGGTMLPFRSVDLADWPFDAAALAPYYRHIADCVGVSGADDGLSNLFGASYVTRPPIAVHRYIERFVDATDGAEIGGLRFTAGINRTAVETRETHEYACVACGECMVGCFRESIFSTAGPIAEYRQAMGFSSVVRRQVIRVDPDAGLVLTASESGTEERHGPFDLIFLGAGCYGTEEIVLRSAPGTASVTMGDNFSINLPILYEGRRENMHPCFGLANALLLITDSDSGECLGQGQIYPTVNHFWRSAVPPILWGAAAFAAAPLKRRLMWMRMYLPHAFANRYRLSVGESGRLHADMTPPVGAMAQAKRLVATLTQVLQGSGFRLINPLMTEGGTSSHYAGGLNTDVLGIGADSCWGQRGVICDSSTWPATPVLSPTFTIMANAMRLADQALS